MLAKGVNECAKLIYEEKYTSENTIKLASTTFVTSSLIIYRLRMTNIMVFVMSLYR